MWIRGAQSSIGWPKRRQKAFYFQLKVSIWLLLCEFRTGKATVSTAQFLRSVYLSKFFYPSAANGFNAIVFECENFLIFMCHWPFLKHKRFAQFPSCTDLCKSGFNVIYSLPITSKAFCQHSAQPRIGIIVFDSRGALLELPSACCCHPKVCI